MELQNYINSHPNYISEFKKSSLKVRSFKDLKIVSHSYDHRVVNGALGSKFIKGVKDYLESWDVNREI